VIEIIESLSNSLSSYDIKFILSYFTISDNKSLINIDVLIKKIIELIGKKYDYEILENLLKYSTDKDLIVAKIIDLKGKELGDEIHLILQYSTDKDIIATKIIDLKGEELLYSNIISQLVKYSEDKDFISTKIIEIKGEKLYRMDIAFLLEYSNDKDFIATKIIEVKGEKLARDEITLLLHYSNDKELIKKTLLQNGVDYKLINNVITRYKIDTPLIPDNYQEMLNEIKRIKEIIR
jgi:hypothetical protein